jgi:hypothetical protein
MPALCLHTLFSLISLSIHLPPPLLIHHLSLSLARLFLDTLALALSPTSAEENSIPPGEQNLCWGGGSSGGREEDVGAGPLYIYTLRQE